MSQNWMWFIWLFESFHLIFREFDIECGNGLIEMVHFGGADDRRCDIRLAQHPCQCNLRAGYTTFLRNLCSATCNGEILFAEIQAICKWIAIGACGFAATAALAVPRKETARHRTPWNETDALILAQRDHLTFLFPIGKVVVILHGDELRPALCFRDMQRPGELPCEHRRCADIARLARTHNIIQRLHCFFDGCFMVPAVN